MNTRIIEEWKAIVGYEEFYEISSFGRCKSLGRVTKFGERIKVHAERILMPKHRNGKYSSYILSVNGVAITFTIHRLVAIHFIENTNDFPTVNHKDGNKQNNHVSNLEWMTRSQNMRHAYDSGLNTRRKLTEKAVKEIRVSTMTDIELGKKFKVTKGNIWNIRKNKSWQHVQ